MKELMAMILTIMIIKEFVNYNEHLYIPKYQFLEHRVVGDNVEKLRKHLECDIALRKDGWITFCEKIEEAEVISE
jgi:hypothetical protein